MKKGYIRKLRNVTTIWQSDKHAFIYDNQGNKIGSIYKSI